MEQSVQNEVQQTALLDRFVVLAAVCVGYFGALVPLALFGREGIWWASILGLAGLPLLTLAGIVGFIFASTVAKHPWRWSLVAAGSAVVLSSLGLWLLTGSPVGVVSILPAVFALPIFRAALTLLGAHD